MRNLILLDNTVLSNLALVGQMNLVFRLWADRVASTPEAWRAQLSGCCSLERRPVCSDDAIRQDPALVVELTLGGVLPFLPYEGKRSGSFNRFDLDLDYVEDLLEEACPERSRRAWSPLITRVHNRATPAAFEIDVDTEAARPELERSIVQELLERDARFRPDAEAWTEVALDVKRMMLEDSPPEAVIDALRESTELVEVRAKADITVTDGEA